jgi:hypothetical protein
MQRKEGAMKVHPGPLTSLLVCAAFPFVGAASSTNTYSLPPQGCVQISNCILYGPAESYSLWTTTKWSIFNLYSWQDGFSVVDTFNCTSETYSTGAAGGTSIAITASCSGHDANGAPFSMTYTVDAYSYYSRGGGGKGGGGAGTRWWVTGGTVTLTH